MPVKVEATPPLPGLSSVCGKPIEARFDGEHLCSDGGLVALREVEARLGVANRLASCLTDPRSAARISHDLAGIIRFRLLMIAAGYEDGNDADRLRQDPMFKLALDRLPDQGGDLCSQPTISRLENLPRLRSLLAMGEAMIGQYCDSFRRVPKRIVLDIDDTFDAVHGAQQLRLFNAHYDEYGFQPIVVFDGDGRPVCAVLRPACRPSGHQIAKWLRRLIDNIRAHWPHTEILLRGDSHYCTPETLRFCRKRGLDFIFGVAPTVTLRKHILDLEKQAVAERAATGKDKIRRFAQFHDAAKSWDRVERIVARVEASDREPGRDVDTRFIVTNLQGGRPRKLYEKIYCRRGQAENHIKAWKTHLAADRTSCCRATANQFRLFLHIGAYWLMWSFRSLMPHRSRWRTVQFDTLRLRMIKIATRVRVFKTKLVLHLAQATPSQHLFRLALSRLDRLTI
jgi:hypothetical protein